MKLHLMVVALGAFCAPLVLAAPQSIAPFPGAQTPTGVFVRDTALEDVNADLLADLLVTESQQLTVFLAASDGTFGQPTSHPVGSATGALEVVDVDGDGVLDAVMTNADHGVSVLLGSAGGGFGPAASFSLGSNFAPGAIAVGDLDSDGDLDLATGNAMGPALPPPPPPGTVATLLGDGEGAFALSSSEEVVGVMWPTPSSVAIGDLNGDGSLDVAASIAGGYEFAGTSIVWYAGDGSGGLGASASLEADPSPLAVKIVDLNGDGHADVAAVSNDAGTACVYVGNGQGQFAPQFLPLGILDNPSSLVIADLSGDGKLDLAAGGSNAGAAAILEGDGQGSFAAPAVIPGPGKLETGDVNGDARFDLVAISGNGLRTVLLSGAHGVIGAGAGFPTGTHPRAITLVDFDLDGLLDVATAGGTFGLAGSVSILLGAGTGGLGAPSNHAVGVTPSSTVAADFDDDGKPDLVTANYGSNDISVLLGDGQGGVVSTSSAQAGNTPASIAAGDSDLDGDVDLVVANETPNSVSLLAGTGTGGFGAPVALAVGTRPRGVVLVDLNGDGFLDIATANYGNSSISVLLGGGPAGFSAATSAYVWPTASSIAAGDVDSDGDLDLAAPSQVGGNLSVCLGDGSGAFVYSGSPVDLGYPFSGGPYAIRFTDVDGDGDADAVTANSSSSNVSVAVGNPGSGLSFGGTFACGVSPLGVGTGDLNSDGRMDLAVASDGLDRVFVLRGVLPAPPGVVPYGSGTPGCSGTHGLLANGAPQVGNSGFGLLATNAPPLAMGLGLVADAADAAGSDPFLIGVVFHLNLPASSLLLPVGFQSDSGGSAFAPLPIPGAPQLQGAVVHAQSIWLWPVAAACDPSPFLLSSSRGLTLTIQ